MYFKEPYNHLHPGPGSINISSLNPKYQFNVGLALDSFMKLHPDNSNYRTWSDIKIDKENVHLEYNII